jgi:hypothetical protein
MFTEAMKHEMVLPSAFKQGSLKLQHLLAFGFQTALLFLCYLFSLNQVEKDDLLFSRCNLLLGS